MNASMYIYIYIYIYMLYSNDPGWPYTSTMSTTSIALRCLWTRKKNTYRLWCELLHPNLGLSNDQWPSNESMLQWLFWIRRFVTKTQAAERVWSNRPGDAWNSHGQTERSGGRQSYRGGECVTFSYQTGNKTLHFPIHTSGFTCKHHSSNFQASMNVPFSLKPQHLKGQNSKLDQVDFDLIRHKNTKQNGRNYFLWMEFELQE